MQSTRNKDLNNTLKLSVLIHQDGLSFLNYTPIDGIMNHWQYDFKFESNPIEILIEIEKVYQENIQLASNSYEDISVVYQHPIFSGVPASIFNEENAANYLKYNNRLLATDIVSHDEELLPLDYKCVYIAYSNINNYFFDKYGDFNYYHYTSIALPFWHEKYKSEQNAVIVDIKKSHLYISIFKKGNLVLHNIYQHDAIEDILYYILFASEHNSLNPETMKLYVYQSKENNQLYELLYTYVRNVKMISDKNSTIDKFLCV